MANEIRLRRNNIAGTITDNPLAFTATVINSPGFSSLPFIGATNHAMLILDPLEQTGAGVSEIVKVVSHASNATSVTVLRDQGGTGARSYPFGTQWVHGPLASDFVLSDVTSSTRPSVPYTGELIYETDTGLYKSFNGSSWVDLAVPSAGAWATYVPASVNVTVGNGTETAKFTRIGRTIHWNYILLWGSTTAFIGTVQIGLPVASGLGTETNHGVCWMQDSSTAANTKVGTTFLTGTPTQVRPVYSGGGSTINATTPFTWAVGDRLTISGTYEAAS